MKHQSELLAAGLASIDDAMCAEVDAEILRRAAAGEMVDATHFRDDGPDPLGIDWAWCEPELDQPAPHAPQPLLSEEIRIKPRYKVRYFLYGGGAVLAASLLLVLVLQFSRNSRNGNVVIAARITAREDAVRGPGTVAEVTVESLSDQRAYLTIVGLSNDRRPAIYYREDQQFIEVAVRQNRTIKNLPASFDGCPVALVILTATPAGEVVRGLTQEPVPPAQAEAERDRLRRALDDAGYRGFAVELIRIGPPGP